MKKTINKQMKKVLPSLKAQWGRYAFLVSVILLVYGILTTRVTELTLISGQKYKMNITSGIALKHNEEFSAISGEELTALKMGLDRFLVFAPGRTEYFHLDVIEGYKPETTELEGEIGDTLRIERYEDVTNTFESDNPDMVAADTEGTLRLRNAGTVNILQTINDFQKIRYTVNVRDPQLVLIPEVIYTGETAIASIENFNGPDTDAAFSSGADCVSIREGHLPSSFREAALESGLDPAGARITGTKAGEALISARINDTKVQAKLRVADPPYIREGNTLLIGDKKKLDIANVIDTVTYESSDPDIVAVQEGLLVPLDSGHCTITARVRGRTVSREFDIPEPEIVCSEPVIGPGEDVSFTVKDLAGDVTWSSSDPDILSMEEDGSARGIVPGKCTVTAHTDLYDFSCDVQVERDYYGWELIPEDLPEGVKALLSCAFYYEECLQKDIGLGLKWQYSNHGWASNFFKMFDVIDSGADGYRSCNCDSGHQWIIQDLEGTKTYKGIADFYSGGPSLKSLMNAGKVRPGDIFMGYRIDSETGKKIGHSFIYLGDNMTFDTGHGSGGWHSDGSIPHTDPRKAVFDTWIHPTDSSFTYTGYTLTKQVRLKDSYTPKRYRNSKGELTAW